jgi:DNA-binding NarL/FixJ family response regulator
MQRTKIILADDHIMVREGLRALVQTDPRIQIVGEAENGAQAVQLAKIFLPDVAVIDLFMPQLNGLEVTRQIVAAVPTTRVLILSSFSNEDYVHELMEAGVAGYLLKYATGNELLKAIHEVDRGNAYFSPEIAKFLRDQFRDLIIGGKSIPIPKSVPKAAKFKDQLTVLEMHQLMSA